MAKFAKWAKFSVGILLFGLLVLGVTGFFLLRSVTGKEESGKHLAHVDWLPKEASDITFVKDNGLFWLLTYECSISRDAFERFAKDQGWPVKEQKNYSGSLRFGLGLSPVRVLSGSPADFYPVALVYEDRWANGGGVTVVYDPEFKRLFVHESSN